MSLLLDCVDWQISGLFDDNVDFLFPPVTELEYSS